jgi:hypothetical protein
MYTKGGQMTFSTFELDDSFRAAAIAAKNSFTCAFEPCIFQLPTTVSFFVIGTLSGDLFLVLKPVNIN